MNRLKIITLVLLFTCFIFDLGCSRNGTPVIPGDILRMTEDFESGWELWTNYLAGDQHQDIDLAVLIGAGPDAGTELDRPVEFDSQYWTASMTVEHYCGDWDKLKYA